MRSPLRLVTRTIWAGGLLTLAYLLYLQGMYAERMPHDPEPATGRIHPVLVLRSQRYVTGAEADRLRWATRIFPLFVVGFIGMVYLQKRQASS